MYYIKKNLILMGVIMMGILLSSCTIGTRSGSSAAGKECNSDLYIAIDLGNLEQINEALEDGANINKLEGLPLDEVNPLKISLGRNNERITEYLIERGADVNYTDKYSTSLLMSTAYNTNVHLSELLIKHGAKIDQKDKKGDTALEYLLQGRNKTRTEKIIHRMITLLIDNGAKIRPNTLKAALNGYNSNGDGDGMYSVVKRILEGLIKEGYKSGLDSVFEAAILGDSSKVGELIKENKLKKENEQQILFYTAAFGKVETIKLLEEKGLGLDSSDSNKNTLLIIASQYGNLEMVKYLLDKSADIEVQNKDSYTALMVAVINDKVEVARYLIKKGAKTFYKLFDYDTIYGAVDEAARNGNLEMVKLIITNGYPLSNEFMSSAMVAASENSRVDSLKYFIDKGADPDIQALGITLLEISCIRGNLEVVKFLVENGASVNGKRVKGKPLINAAQHGNTDIVEYLISKGANVNAIPVYEDGSRGGSALISAVMGGYLDIVKLLVENGADLEYQEESSDKETVVMVAARNGSRHILEYLVQKGANINYQDQNGKTALMYTVTSGQKDNVEVLMKYKPDLSLKDKDGHTALDMAKERKKKDIIKILENTK